jgi:hypothetical protein
MRATQRLGLTAIMEDAMMASVAAIARDGIPSAMSISFE